MTRIVVSGIEHPLYDAGEKVREITRHRHLDGSPAFIDVVRDVEDPLDWFNQIANTVTDKVKKESKP